MKGNTERRKAEVLIVSYLLGLVEFVVKVTSLSLPFLYAYHSYYDKHFYSTLCSFRLRGEKCSSLHYSWHMALSFVGFLKLTLSQTVNFECAFFFFSFQDPD